MSHGVAHARENVLIHSSVAVVRQNSNNSAHREGGPFIPLGRASLGRELALDFKRDARRHKLIMQRDRPETPAKRIRERAKFFDVALLNGPRRPGWLALGGQSDGLEVIKYNYSAIHVDFAAFLGVGLIAQGRISERTDRTIRITHVRNEIVVTTPVL